MYVCIHIYRLWRETRLSFDCCLLLAANLKNEVNLFNAVECLISCRIYYRILCDLI